MLWERPDRSDVLTEKFAYFGKFFAFGRVGSQVCQVFGGNQEAAALFVGW